ncbi:hypothetical protein [Mesoplasma florum]|uniref:hypothetical protein n=1 Tax=Mesoplasma florum TaxID=2151 RepID=UPI000D08E297|nr:hypothetical protein [Mesoplasma florum]AVN60991.1 hypothetical protein CG005_01640 [Mesoplasma florum]
MEIFRNMIDWIIEYKIYLILFIVILIIFILITIIFSIILKKKNKNIRKNKKIIEEFKNININELNKIKNENFVLINSLKEKENELNKIKLKIDNEYIKKQKYSINNDWKFKNKKITSDEKIKILTSLTAKSWHFSDALKGTKNENSSGIYVITIGPYKKYEEWDKYGFIKPFYVGKATNLTIRFNTHFHLIKKAVNLMKSGKSLYFEKDFNARYLRIAQYIINLEKKLKNTEILITFHVLEYVNTKDLKVFNEKEKEWIEAFDSIASGFNVLNGNTRFYDEISDNKVYEYQKKLENKIKEKMS